MIYIKILKKIINFSKIVNLICLSKIVKVIKKGGINLINQIILVGRLTEDPKIEEYDDTKKRTIITLAVQRNFKNVDCKYETDFFRCVLWNGLASNTKEFCHRGDILGIKGRLQNRSYVDDKNITKYITEVIAEKISFVTTSKNKNTDDESSFENIIECC